MNRGFPRTTLDTPDPDSLTYEPYFGLREKAFGLAPNPRFFFKDPSRAAAFDALVAAIRRREGIIALTGEVGTGKTILCRAVLDALDKKTFSAYVPDPFLSREDLLKTLLVDFGVASVEELRGGKLSGASRTELNYPLYDFLSSLRPLRAFAVVMIDEAQNLPPALLEEIRILADIGGGDNLLQLVLVGQPELNESLRKPELRQLKQRVTAHVEVGPLAPGEIENYIRHRLAVAGNRSVLFDRDVLNLVFAASNGVPRVINLLCDRALSRAAAARSSRIRAEDVSGAASDLRMQLPAPAPPAATSGTEPIVTEPLPETSNDRRVTPKTRSRQGLPSTYQMRHDAHYVEELEARAVASVNDTTEQPTPLASEHPDGERKQRKAWKFLTGAACVLVLTVAGFWLYGSEAESVRDVPAVAAAAPVVQAPAATADISTPTASPPVAPAPAPSPVPDSSDPGVQFAIQIATFLSATGANESVRELQSLGFGAFQTEVSLRTGRRAFVVFLGPYSERELAERDNERAQAIPGYAEGRIIEISGTLGSRTATSGGT